MVMGGNPNPEFQFRILDTFSKAATDKNKAEILSKMATTYSDSYKNNKWGATFPAVKGQPVGTLIRPNSPIPFKDRNGNSLKLFGRTN
jgi:hypothetical protein